MTERYQPKWKYGSYWGTKIYERCRDGYPFYMHPKLRPWWKHFIDKYGSPGRWAEAERGSAERVLRKLRSNPEYYLSEGYTREDIENMIESFKLRIEALQWCNDERFMHEWAFNSGQPCYGIPKDAPEEERAETKQREKTSGTKNNWKNQDERRAWKDLKNAYVMLNAWPEDDQSELKRKWKAAMIKAHPDRGGSTTKAQSINWAYEHICLVRGWK